MSDNKNGMADTSQPIENAPIHIECVQLKHVVSSTAEAESRALFHNTKMEIFIVNILEALGHKQETVKSKQIIQLLKHSATQHLKKNVQKLGT